LYTRGGKKKKKKRGGKKAEQPVLPAREAEGPEGSRSLRRKVGKGKGSKPLCAAGRPKLGGGKRAGGSQKKKGKRRKKRRDASNNYGGPEALLRWRFLKKKRNEGRKACPFNPSDQQAEKGGRGIVHEEKRERKGGKKGGYAVEFVPLGKKRGRNSAPIKKKKKKKKKERTAVGSLAYFRPGKKENFKRQIKRRKGVKKKGRGDRLLREKIKRRGGEEETINTP